MKGRREIGNLCGKAERNRPEQMPLDAAVYALRAEGLHEFLWAGCWGWDAWMGRLQ